jgi:hypothetical protein
MIKTQHCPNCETQAVEIERLRQTQTDALKIAREGLERIKNRKWNTMTQGCDAAVEAANIARDTLAAMEKSK